MQITRQVLVLYLLSCWAELLLAELLLAELLLAEEPAVLALVHTGALPAAAAFAESELLVAAPKLLFLAALVLAALVGLDLQAATDLVSSEIRAS